jgi:hypothetical protein
MHSMPINGIIQGVNDMMTLNREDKALETRGFAITASEAAFEAQGTEAALLGPRYLECRSAQHL